MSSVIANFPVIKFKKHKSNHQVNSNMNSGFKVSPLLVDFGLLLKTQDHKIPEAVSGIPNLELLHAVATLYGVSLSEVTNDIIYPILCEKLSKTLLMVLDETQAGERVKESLMSFATKKSIENVTSHKQLNHQHHIRHKKINNDKKVNEKLNNDRFVNIFSDDDNSSNEDNQSDDEIDFSTGIDDFLQAVDERRKAQQHWFETHHSNTFIGSHSEVESLPLVRRKYRSLGIGSFILKQLLNPSVTGGSDAIVVNADPNAAEFFAKHGFSDDAILNSRFANVGDLWFNCKRMVYLQGYTKGKVSSSHGENYYSLREMEMDINEWKKSSTESYQSYASIVQRMKHEIENLKSQVYSKEHTISHLQHELVIKSSHHLGSRKAVDKSSSAFDMDSIPSDIQTEISSPIGMTNSELSHLQLTQAHDYDILSEFLLGSVDRDQSPSRSSSIPFLHHHPRKDSFDHAHEASSPPVPKYAFLPPDEADSSMQPLSQEPLASHRLSKHHTSHHDNVQMVSQYSSTSVNNFIDHSPSVASHNKISLDGYTSHVAVDSGMHGIMSDDSFASRVESDNFAAFCEESSEKLRSFMQKSTDDFQDFAQKSRDEFRSFSGVSSDYRELFILEMKRCFIDSITYHGGSLPCDKTQILDVIIAELPDEVTSRFTHAVTHSHDPDVVMNLYFCGGEHHRVNSDSFRRIISSGFATEDFVESEFGNGLHFSQYVDSATYFSPSGCVLVGQVCLGRNQTLTSKDSRRQHAPEGFDSVLTSGRLSDSRYNLHSHGDAESSEYMVFDPNLALPLAIVQYEVMH